MLRRPSITFCPLDSGRSLNARSTVSAARVSKGVQSADSLSCLRWHSFFTAVLMTCDVCIALFSRPIDFRHRLYPATTSPSQASYAIAFTWNMSPRVEAASSHQILCALMLLWLCSYFYIPYMASPISYLIESAPTHCHISKHQKFHGQRSMLSAVIRGLIGSSVLTTHGFLIDSPSYV